jgi:hypothetical protein
MITLNFSRKGFLVAISFLASLLPYLILYTWYSVDFTRGYDLSLPLAFVGSLLWLVLTTITLFVGHWQRKLLWLFALFPVAFGPWLVILYIYIHAWLFGFAP